MMWQNRKLSMYSRMVIFAYELSIFIYMIHIGKKKFHPKRFSMDKWKSKVLPVCNGDLTRSISFYTKHPITIFFVLFAQWYCQMQWYQTHVKATYIEYCVVALPVWGGPLWTPTNWFFERFYIIKSNWKSPSLFCLLFPLASCCRTLPWDKWKKGYYQYVTVTFLGLFLSTPNIL